jgi:hypothetical protein
MNLRLSTVRENVRRGREYGPAAAGPLSLRPARWPWSAVPYLGKRGREQAHGIKAVPPLRDHTPERLWFLLAPLLLASCSRAPSFDILGSFFPAWLVCLAVAILLTALARWLLLRLHIAVVLPILVYPSLTFLFAFALWLVFFR